jgi:hypothetical protein
MQFQWFSLNIMSNQLSHQICANYALKGMPIALSFLVDTTLHVSNALKNASAAQCAEKLEIS